MPAADPILPLEEVALMDLGPAPPLPKAPEDPEATLPWDRAPGRARASPDGGREGPEEAGAGPEVAPMVVVPIDPHCIEQSPPKGKKQQEEGKGGAVPRSQHPLLLPMGPSRSRDPLGLEGRVAKPNDGARCPWAKDCGGGDHLKALASVLGALVLCPCFVYGAYVFLPFDAPLLPTISTRLVYTLRCAAFATVPIVLGMLVSGVSRLCSWAREPCGELRREVEIHSTFVGQSAHLFVLYFFNVAVLATYLPQELLKLIPLLTGLFAISRLLHWLAFAMGRSFRVFSLSLSFLPLVAVLLWNLYSMLVLEPQNLLAVPEAKPPEQPKSAGAKLRYWG
ncbi:transmembrane protein 79 [Neopsephotus bourkii]|uniref:transmembrane protein 79 n=1 Tax=Neopsephotus bourkii TaxID=309878 RepID=UPI002AA53949|nr:transmembrane protein 79 [Neopsephotus bourkii]